MKNQSFLIYFLLIIGVVAVSTSAIFVKLITAPAGVTAFYRLFFSVLLLLPIFLYKYVAELKSITKKDWVLCILGGIFLAFHFILWFESLNYTSVASSTVLVTLQPIFAFLGTYLIFNERFSKTKIICGIVAIVGSVIISWGDFYIDKSALFGDLLALIACGLITAYFLLGQSVRQRVSLITYTFLIYAISAITLFIYVIGTKESFFSYPTSDWIYFICLAIVPTLLGHSIFNWVIKWISTSTISMAILFEPVGAVVLAYIILGEKLVWTQVLGGILVLWSIVLFLINEKKQKNFKKTIAQ